MNQISQILHDQADLIGAADTAKAGLNGGYSTAAEIHRQDGTLLQLCESGQASG